MKKAVFSTFCLILILSLQALAQGQSTLLLSDDNATPAPHQLQVEWRVSLLGYESNDINTESNLVGVSIDLRSLYYLNSSLFIDLQPSLRFAAGSYQSFEGADNEGNSFVLHQAAVHYRPSSFFNLSAGALNQHSLHTSLLMNEDLAFPGARFDSEGNLGNWSSGISAESAIPTSTSLSSNTNSLEATPNFNTLALHVNWMPSKMLYWKNSVDYFQFTNLPSAVAQQSMLLGNDVTQVSDADYAFNYQFAGIEAHSEVKFPVSIFDLGFGGEYVENKEAPSSLNSAYKVYVFTGVPITSSMDLGFKASRFSIAPDAVVAYFNSWDYEANRVGYSLEASLRFKKEKFAVSMKYSDAQVMYLNPNQSEAHILYIRLETFYADI